MEGGFQRDEASSATISCVGSAALFATCNYALVQATCRAPGPCIYLRSVVGESLVSAYIIITCRVEEGLYQLPQVTYDK
jgi:hypothetical protein